MSTEKFVRRKNETNKDWMKSQAPISCKKMLLFRSRTTKSLSFEKEKRHGFCIAIIWCYISIFIYIQFQNNVLHIIVHCIIHHSIQFSCALLEVWWHDFMKRSALRSATMRNYFVIINSNFTNYIVFLVENYSTVKGLITSHEYEIVILSKILL